MNRPLNHLLRTLFNAAVLIGNCSFISGTSIKMDFLPIADVRTDPVINPDCLSGKVCESTTYLANINKVMIDSFSR